jgi:prepilin-type N-terminal cleavage/methylation domain-containing protein
MKMRKTGFTLMEIMVVIIVIAVLASVAGPMIGSITDQGRTSATKGTMSALKSAMLAYRSDVGRVPFNGCAANVDEDSAYNDADDNLLGILMECNVLVNETLGDADVPATIENFSITNYSRKWKGPYMDQEPGDFMLDSWGTKLKYVGYPGNKTIYLQSAGPDMAHEASSDFDCVLDPDNEENDDFVHAITKLRKLN